MFLFSLFVQCLCTFIALARYNTIINMNMTIIIHGSTYFYIFELCFCFRGLPRFEALARC